MQTDLRLTAVSYMVLGLIELAGGEATPYALKQFVPPSVGNFWTVGHPQLYTEPERLARAGLLAEEREEGGRRRRMYRLTPAGRKALDAWRATPAGELGELRNPGLLQLFFGAEKAPLAEAVARGLHGAKLAKTGGKMLRCGEGLGCRRASGSRWRPGSRSSAPRWSSGRSSSASTRPAAAGRFLQWPPPPSPSRPSFPSPAGARGPRCACTRC